MDPAESTADPAPPGSELDALRVLMITATQQLLGDTISVTDESWRGPSRLPGWTRGHVATHLARQADALVRLIEGARSGDLRPMYDSSAQRDAEIEAGADRTGLGLQIDLDTSAGTLSEAFETVELEAAWDKLVELRGGDVAPVRLLPLARLCEVVLHHVDLDIGLDIGDVDQPTADWLLEWLSFRLGPRVGFPKINVLSDSGLAVVVGHDEQAIDVRGSSAEVLGWLTGRSTGESLRGADGLTLPPF